MTRADSLTTTTPTAPDLSAEYPVRVDRRRAAELVTKLFFPISPRTLEVWPLTVRHVNGKAIIETAELFALAKVKLDSAPVIRGGWRPVGKEQL